MDASVIVATYNRASSLAAALASILGQKLPSAFTWELIVVDNNSTDTTRAVVESFAGTHDNVRYLFEPRQGKSHALNTAVAQARGGILAFTDDDVTVDPGWLANLVAAFRTFQCAGAAGKVVPVWTTPKPKWWFDVEGADRLGPAIVNLDLGPEPCELKEGGVGANLAFKRDALVGAGLFRTDLGISGGERIGAEDADICRRLRTTGGRMMYVPGAVVFHPVEEARARREYFEHWYFCLGKAVARSEGASDATVRYFGVPRYLLREGGSRLIRWIVTLDARRRFYHKLRLWLVIGQALELRRMYAPQVSR